MSLTALVLLVAMLICGFVALVGSAAGQRRALASAALGAAIAFLLSALTAAALD